MGTFFSRLFKPPETPRFTVEKPEAVPLPEAEDAGTVSKQLKRRRGRGATVLAGELEPKDIGKSTLLG
jgi:hypothetical protein